MILGVVEHEPPGGCIQTDCVADCVASESQQFDDLLKPTGGVRVVHCFSGDTRTVDWIPQQAGSAWKVGRRAPAYTENYLGNEYMASILEN